MWLPAWEPAGDTVNPDNNHFVRFGFFQYYLKSMRGHDKETTQYIMNIRMSQDKDKALSKSMEIQANKT